MTFFYSPSPHSYLQAVLPAILHDFLEACKTVTRLQISSERLNKGKLLHNSPKISSGDFPFLRKERLLRNICVLSLTDSVGTLLCPYPQMDPASFSASVLGSQRALGEQ